MMGKRFYSYHKATFANSYLNSDPQLKTGKEYKSHLLQSTDLSSDIVPISNIGLPIFLSRIYSGSFRETTSTGHIC